MLFSPSGPDDATLAAALRRSHAVAGEVVTLAQPGSDGVYPVRDAIGPVKPIAAAAPVGHTAVIPDPGDGLVRTVPLAVDDGRNFVPALSLAALARADGVPPVVILRPDAVQVGRRVIPTTAQHELTLSYAPTPPVISAADVLAGKVPRSALRDKIVFVGVTDLTIGDRVLTPVDGGRGYPGVMTHVMAANTMLTQTYLHPVSDASVALWVFLLALLGRAHGAVRADLGGRGLGVVHGRRIPRARVHAARSRHGDELRVPDARGRGRDSGVGCGPLRARSPPAEADEPSLRAVRPTHGGARELVHGSRARS